MGGSHQEGFLLAGVGLGDGELHWSKTKGRGWTARPTGEQGSPVGDGPRSLEVVLS